MLQSVSVQANLPAAVPPAPDHAGTLDEHVVALSALGARMLDAENCSITLFAEGASHVAPAATAANGPAARTTVRRCPSTASCSA